MILAWFKRLLCRLGIPFTEICQRCGFQVAVVWRASDELWERIVGRPGGVLCVKCFDELCKQRGLFLYWRASIEPFAKGEQ